MSIEIMVPEDPPGFVIRTEAEKAAWDNGYRIPRGLEAGWLHFASTTAPGSIWIAGVSDRGPWLVALDHPGVAAELAPLRAARIPAPGLATFILATTAQLHAAVDRIYKLAVSLPDVPLTQFLRETAHLPQSTEVERLVVQRKGQDIFRVALMQYWGDRCPLTGITEPDLLRASHIVPWSECGNEMRLGVHNGLLLSALWDAAFDRGLVSFTDDGGPMLSPRLTLAARTALGPERALPIPSLRPAHRANLAQHRARKGF